MSSQTALGVPNSRKLFSKNTTWKFMQIMCNVIWRVVITLLFSRGILSWFVLVLSKEIIRSSEEL